MSVKCKAQLEDLGFEEVKPGLFKMSAGGVEFYRDYREGKQAMYAYRGAKTLPVSLFKVFETVRKIERVMGVQEVVKDAEDLMSYVR